MPHSSYEQAEARRKSLVEEQAQHQALLAMSAKTTTTTTAAAVGVENKTAPPTAGAAGAAAAVTARSTVPLIVGPEGCCNSCGVPFLSSPRTLDPDSVEQFDMDLQTETRNDIVWCPLCSSKYHIRCTGVTYSPYVFVAQEEREGFACQKCLDRKQASLEFDTHLGPSSQALSLISQVPTTPHTSRMLHTPFILHTLYVMYAVH